jgi:hypothetical protein
MSRELGGFGASGVVTGVVEVSSRRCSGVELSGVLSLPVKTGRGTHIRMPGCDSAYTSRSPPALSVYTLLRSVWRSVVSRSKA